MEKVRTVAVVIFTLCLIIFLPHKGGVGGCGWAQSREQQTPTTLELQRMELRALAAEIQIMQQTLNDKVIRARELQALIQAEESKGQKAQEKTKEKK